MLISNVTTQRKELSSANDALISLEWNVSAGLGTQKALCKTKIYEVYRAGLLALANHDILRFHISVNKILRM